MRMDELNTFTQDDGAQVRQKSEKVGERRGRSDCRERYVVYLQKRQEPTNAYPVGRMTMRDDNDLVATNDQTELVKQDVKIAHFVSFLNKVCA